jgi:hypothetical protein
MCNVYGVEVPGADGRAGMGALVFDPAVRFDGAALYRHVLDVLPAYAAPIFVRLQDEPEVTVTFKLRKIDLQRAGYDPDQMADPIFIRDDDARAYIRLTPERYATIRAGEQRF